MKAAVLHEIGGIPRYEDFSDPVPGDGEVTIEVTAVALENVDKAIAAGTHYSSAGIATQFPMIPGLDGIGALPDGTLVGFGGLRAPYGAFAEKVVLPQGYWAPIPSDIDPAIAAVQSSAIAGLSVRTAGGLRAGETVLVQGATGVAGRLAVQVSRILGAGRIVATGRDDAQLAEVRALGADAVINTAVGDDELVRAFADARGDGYDVVIDFLWGRPTELLLRSLIPDGFGLPKATRVVQVGESAGRDITIPASALRTSGVELYGAGRGATAESMAEAYQQVVEWTRSGELVFDVERVPLADIESAWQRTDLKGRRLVVVP